MPQITPSQAQQLASQLDSAYTALLDQVRDELASSEAQHFQDLAGAVHDQGEESVADMLSDLGAAMIDRHIKALRDIEHARQALRDGTYGVCIDCAADIGFARLSATPTACRCIGCQGAHEKAFSQSIRPSL